MRTAAVLPVKRFEMAKRRLRADVSDSLRGELARAMLSDVLDALARCAAVERTIVVTAEAGAAVMAEDFGADVIADADERGQSIAVAHGIEHAVAAGYGRVVCVPGDCPALLPGDLDVLLSPSAREREQVVIVPDRHGTGTNALVLRPPGAIAPSFGPQSFERHLRLAEAAGVSMSVMRPPSLVLDIDTGEDLAALRRELGPRAAAHTRALLDAHDLGDAVVATPTP
jgi:2-phospho-L-lactate guanylyltransferase